MNKVKKWIKAAGIRAIRTTAQTALAMIPAGVTIEDVGWNIVISTSILSGVLSLLTSIAGLPELENERSDYSWKMK